MAAERICMMCGAKYEYCNHCRDAKPDETWKFLYHDKKCMELSNIWYAYRGKEISKKEAKERMSEIKPNIDAVLKYSSIAAKEIRDIFNVHEETPAKVTKPEEKPVKQAPVQEANSEQQALAKREVKNKQK